MSNGGDDLPGQAADEMPTVPGHHIRRDADGWYTAEPKNGSEPFRGPDQAVLTQRHHERLYAQIRARRHFLT